MGRGRKWERETEGLKQIERESEREDFHFVVEHNCPEMGVSLSTRIIERCVCVYVWVCLYVWVCMCGYVCVRQCEQDMCI